MANALLNESRATIDESLTRRFFTRQCSSVKIAHVEPFVSAIRPLTNTSNVQQQLAVHHHKRNSPNLHVTYIMCTRILFIYYIYIKFNNGGPRVE